VHSLYVSVTRVMISKKVFKRCPDSSEENFHRYPLITKLLDQIGKHLPIFVSCNFIKLIKYDDRLAVIDLRTVA